uniref:Uncharacterized protein n=1 Tax=Ciona savignyi TaxID=51511 RepID=H2Z5U8_CIOSA
MSLRLNSSSRSAIKTLKAPPSTPREMYRSTGSYDHSPLQETGDIQGGEKKTGITYSASKGDCIPTPCAQDQRKDNGTLQAKERKIIPPLKRNKSSPKVHPVPMGHGPTLIVTKPARHPLVGAAEPVAVVKTRRSFHTQEHKTDKRPNIRRSGTLRNSQQLDGKTSPNPKTGSSTKVSACKKTQTAARSMANNDVTKRINSKVDVKRQQEQTNKAEQKELEKPVIRHFAEMPKSRPKRVSFDYPGVDITHVDVKRAIERVIPDSFEANKVTSIQFENVNIKLGTGGLNNRWLIELADFNTRNKLIKAGLELRCLRRHDDDLNTLNQLPSNRSRGTANSNAQSKMRVEVKLHDNVQMEEYKQFLRRTAAEEKLQSVILICAGRGQNLLSKML